MKTSSNFSSAESAFDMLLKFEKNNTRMTIQDEMHKRFNDILRQYDNEVSKNMKIELEQHYFSYHITLDYRNQQYISTQQDQPTC